MLSLFAHGAAAAIAAKEGLSVFAQFAESAEFAEIARPFEAAELQPCIVQEVVGIFVVEHIWVRLRDLVGIIAPGKALLQLTSEQPARHPRKAQPHSHGDYEQDFEDQYVAPLHCLCRFWNLFVRSDYD